MWTSRRPSLDAALAPPVVIPQLNSPFDELSLRLSSDGATLYFAYDTERWRTGRRPVDRVADVRSIKLQRVMFRDLPAARLLPSPKS